MTNKIRKKVIYEGRVQGVNFRNTAVGISRSYELAGHVRNLSNGTVELEVEGPADSVSKFLEEIREEMHSNIRHIYEQNVPVSGEEKRFEVKY